MTDTEGGSKRGDPAAFVGDGPLARLFVGVQGLGRWQLVAGAVLVGVAPLLVGAVIAAAGGFLLALLRTPTTYLLAAGLAGEYLLVGWAVHRYPALWADLADAVEDEAAYWAAVEDRVAAMADPRLLAAVPAVLLVLVAYDLLLFVPKLVSSPAVGSDAQPLLAAVNYAYGVVALPVLVVGPALLYHHVRLVDEVAALGIDDADPTDLEPLLRYGAVLAAGMLGGVAVFVLDLLALASQQGLAPVAVPETVVSVPVFGATVLFVLGAAAATYLLPGRSLGRALDAGQWLLYPRWVGRRLGDRRVQVALVAALLLVVAAGWGLFLHRPGPDQATSTPFTTDEPPVDGSYRSVAYAHASTPNASSYVEEVYVYAPGDPAVALSRRSIGTTDGHGTNLVYQRGTARYARSTRIIPGGYEPYVAGPGPLNRTVNGTRTVYEFERDDSGVEAAPDTSLVGTRLGLLPYERAGTATYEGRQVDRYVPHAGWLVVGDARPATRATELEATARIRAASGEVLVDPETGALLSADVRATVVDASTWWEALTGEPIEFAIRYRVEPGVDRPEAPPWVDGLDAAANATG